MDEHEVRIVLLGKTGTGKSSFVNTFFEKNMCEVTCSPKSQTQICQRYEGEISGRRFAVIDTPGIFDTDRSEEDLKPEIISCLVECAPGPHVFILVLEVTTCTMENQKAVSNLLEYFGEEIFNHLVVLFTHGDKLDKNMTIQDFINKSDVKSKKQKLNLMELSKKCENRVHVIDNKHWNNSVLAELAKLNISQEALKEIAGKLQTSDGDYRNNKNQIIKFMESIEKILKKNEYHHYTNKCLEELGDQIKGEERKILQENENDVTETQPVNRAEVRRRARERVRTKIQRTLSGVAVGTLLGALLGLGVGIAAPAVFVAGFIRAGWRKLNGQTPANNETMKKTDIAVKGAGAAVAVGLVTDIGLAVGEAAVLGAGVATGIGAGVGAGILLAYGVGKGVKSGIDASKVSDNPNQAAQNVTQALTDNAKDMLKACWNVGSKDSGGENEPLIKKGN